MPACVHHVMGLGRHGGFYESGPCTISCTLASASASSMSEGSYCCIHSAVLKFLAADAHLHSASRPSLAAQTSELKIWRFQGMPGLVLFRIAFAHELTKCDTL
jgi:hypothetical protein